MVDHLDSTSLTASVSLTDAAQQLSRLLLGAQLFTETLQVVARLAASTIPSVDEVSITLIDLTDGTRTTAFSGSLAATLDERQYEPGFGPCLTAAHSGGVVRIDDTTADTSHPDFAAVARRRGVRSALAMSLLMPAGVHGALGLYRTSSEGLLSSEAEAVAASFAATASVVLANASLVDGLQRRAAQLENAMTSREVIDLAKGIVMQLGSCDAEEAFRLLARQSQRSNRKLREVATELVAGAVRGVPAEMPLLLTGVTKLT